LHFLCDKPSKLGFDATLEPQNGKIYGELKINLFSNVYGNEIHWDNTCKIKKIKKTKSKTCRKNIEDVNKKQ
jgi:hypothetical protein